MGDSQGFPGSGAYVRLMQLFASNRTCYAVLESLFLRLRGNLSPAHIDGGSIKIPERHLLFGNISCSSPIPILIFGAFDVILDYASSTTLHFHLTAKKGATLISRILGSSAAGRSTSRHLSKHRMQKSIPYVITPSVPRCLVDALLTIIAHGGRWWTSYTPLAATSIAASLLNSVLMLASAVANSASIRCHLRYGSCTCLFGRTT